MGELDEQRRRSTARARKLALETAQLVAHVKETVADARNRVYAIRLLREVRKRNLGS